LTNEFFEIRLAFFDMGSWMKVVHPYSVEDIDQSKEPEKKKVRKESFDPRINQDDFEVLHKFAVTLGNNLSDYSKLVENDAKGRWVLKNKCFEISNLFGELISAIESSHPDPLQVVVEEFPLVTKDDIKGAIALWIKLGPRK